jgi:hypothetical protein
MGYQDCLFRAEIPLSRLRSVYPDRGPVSHVDRWEREQRSELLELDAEAILSLENSDGVPKMTHLRFVLRHLVCAGAPALMIGRLMLDGSFIFTSGSISA